MTPVFASISKGRILPAFRILLWLMVLVPFAGAQVPTVHAEFPSPDSEVSITEWQIVGPFLFDAKDLEKTGARLSSCRIRNWDYLKEFGLDESSVDAAGLVTAKEAKTGFVLSRRFCNKVVSVAPKTKVLELAGSRNPLEYAVAYLAAVIESPRDQDVVIAAGVDDAMRIWLNQELLFADAGTTPHRFEKFQRVIGARLKKGNNFLLVKVANLQQEWRLIVTLHLHERGLVLAQENGINPIFQGSVVREGGPIVWRSDLLTRTAPAFFTLYDSQHKVVDSGPLTPGAAVERYLTKIPQDRVYYGSVSFANQRIEKLLYYGDPDRGYQRLTDEVSALKNLEEPVAIELGAELFRLKHLLAPQNRKFEFDQRIAAHMSNIENGLARLREYGAAGFRQSAGTHLRGYRPMVDGQLQYYWLHVPEKPLRAGGPIPLVIVLPYTTGVSAEFLKSYFLIFEETERYSRLSEESGFAVLQVWGRGNYLGGTALGTADIFEALDAVRRDYRIDSDRIYLLGYCEGGRLALLLGERYPNRFAAIAAEGAITVSRSRAPFASSWAQYASPMSAIEKLGSTPVFLTHDAYDSDSFGDSMEFASKAKTAGVNVTFARREDGKHGFYRDPMAVKRSMFQFFEGKRLSSQPLASEKKPDAASPTSTFGAGRGPIEDAFGASILLVEATQGTAAQREVIHALVEEFRKQWREAYFVDCPIKQETDVSAADLQHYNLIIVGNQETSALIKRMADTLGFGSSEAGVSFGGRNYEGKKLGYELIARNPLAPSRYAVIVGMNNWSATQGWRLNLAKDGICDYFVFDFQGPTPKIKDAGYFDDLWWRVGTARRPQQVNRV